MAIFIKAFNFMIINEDATLSGKIVMDNNGALVRYGVNAATNPTLVPTGFFDTLPNGQPKMPNDQALIVAKNLYNTKYWGKVAGDPINSQCVASKMLDCEVNTGDAPKLLQHYLHTVDSEIVVDGVIGPKTLTLVNSLDQMKVLAGFILWWNWYITQELKNNPQDERYERNWRLRAAKIPPLA